MITFYAVTLQKPFFTDRIKKFDLFKATHFQTLNIHKTYLHIKVFFLGSIELSSIRIKQLQYLKKTILRSLLKNLIL